MLFLPSSTSAAVYISEIMYDAPGADTKAEWVELQNTGSVSVDISKWKVSDASKHVLNAPPKNGSKGSMILAPNSFLILAADAPMFLSAHKNVHYAVIDTSLSLGNAGGTISLFDASSTLQDSATYSATEGGEGNGESLQKINGTFVPGIPTPGSINSEIRIEKPVVEKSLPTPKKTKKTASRSKSKTVSEPRQPVYKNTDPNFVIPETATSVVPVVDESPSLAMSPWMYGAFGTAIAGAGAALVANRKKKDEWDIIEEMDDSV